MVIGGVALRIRNDAPSSGVLRLKRSTAEQFFGEEALQLGMLTCYDGRNTSLLERDAVAVRLNLHAVEPSTSHTPGTSPLALPSPVCEMRGLGSWLRG